MDTIKLPSEILNQGFVLDDSSVEEQIQAAEKFWAITTHGVVIGNIGLLLPQDRVSELIENVSICRLPNTSPWFQGITSVRGNMVPVFDLHQQLGMPATDTERKMIMVDSGETAAMFWIDYMPRLVMVTSDDMMPGRPPLPQLIADHARNFYLKDDQIWIDWDIRAFFTSLGTKL